MSFSLEFASCDSYCGAGERSAVIRVRVIVSFVLDSRLSWFSLRV